MFEMHEKLRPLWHQQENYENEYLDDMIHVNLINNSGEVVSEVSLYVDLKELRSYIELRITQGIKSFFDGMNLAFKSQGVKPDKVNIFLAGNSCKSKLVTELFDSACEKYEQEFIKKHGYEKAEDDLFEIYPPLASEACFKKMEEKNIKFDRNKPYFPDGKTGVAIGLLNGRPGGHVQVIDVMRESTNGIGFRFNIGTERRHKWQPIIKLNTKVDDPNHAMNGYEKFRIANADVLELLYTENPSAGEKDGVSIEECKRVKLKLPHKGENLMVWLRPSGPMSIEYILVDKETTEQYGDFTGKLELN